MGLQVGQRVFQLVFRIDKVEIGRVNCADFLKGSLIHRDAKKTRLPVGLLDTSTLARRQGGERGRQEAQAAFSPDLQCGPSVS